MYYRQVLKTPLTHYTSIYRELISGAVYQGVICSLDPFGILGAEDDGWMEIFSR